MFSSHNFLSDCPDLIFRKKAHMILFVEFSKMLSLDPETRGEESITADGRRVHGDMERGPT